MGRYNAIIRHRRRKFYALLHFMDNKVKRNKPVGSIILADFLEYGLEKFIKFIQAVEALTLYKKLTCEGIIIPKHFSDAKILRDDSTFVHSVDGVIAKIKKDINCNFYIQYIREEFSIEYKINVNRLKRFMNDLN